MHRASIGANGCCVDVGSPARACWVMKRHTWPLRPRPPAIWGTCGFGIVARIHACIPPSAWFIIHCLLQRVYISSSENLRCIPHEWKRTSCGDCTNQNPWRARRHSIPEHRRRGGPERARGISIEILLVLLKIVYVASSTTTYETPRRSDDILQGGRSRIILSLWIPHEVRVPTISVWFGAPLP